MSSFLRSLKYLRCIKRVYKRIRINDRQINVRNLSYLPNDVTPQRSELTNSFLRCKENYICEKSYIDNIIDRMDHQFRKTGIIFKSSIEEIICHVEETAGQIETSQALLTLRYSNLLIQCTPQERVKLVETLWKLLNLYHIPLDIFHYNALLQVYIDNRHAFSPMEILTAMKEQGILPDNTTYKCLLEYYCKNGSMSDSAVVLQCMKEEKYFLNESIFKLLILGYSEAGDLKNARNILGIMKKMHITPKMETYTAIMCAYAKVNDIESINTVLSHYKKMGIQFSNNQILDVIYTFIVNNNMDHVNEMFTKIEKLCFPAEMYFLSRVMDTKQDIAMNMFCCILSKNHNEVTYNKLLCFFINKLLHSNVCPENITNACIHFETEYNDKKAFNKAIYFSFQHDNDVITLHLLKAWKNRGCKLKPHYFWPILAKLIKKNDIQGLLHSVKEMIVTYNVTPCIDTLTNFIIPHIFYDIATARGELHKCGIPDEVIHNAVAYEFLRNNKMRRASTYMKLNRGLYRESILKDVLHQALHRTCDVYSFFAILRKMYKETESGELGKVSINEALLDTINFIGPRTNCIPPIIQYLYNNQMKISNDVYKVLSFHVKDNLSLDVLQQLKNMNEDSSRKHDALLMKKEEMQENNLMPRLINSSASSDVMSSYRNFLTLKRRNMSIPHYEYVKLMECLLEQNLREESKFVIKHLVTDYPVTKTLIFVLKQIKNLILTGYFNDAAEVVEDTLKRIKIENYEKLKFYLKNLLECTISRGNEKEVNRLFNILLKTGYLQPSEETLRPLIMVHINQGNAIKALETSELLCEKYQYIPALTELTKLIILAEDTKILQRFVDVTTKVYELQYILGELLLCFLENDYEKEAKKIIELLATSNYKFTSIKVNILRCVHGKRIEVLEKLLNCSVDYPGMDRLFIYNCLLHIYDINNDYQSGLHLWTNITKEGLSPTEDFVKNCTNLIQRNNKDKSFIPSKIGSA